MKYKRELLQKFNLLLNRIKKLTDKDWIELQNLSDAFLEDFEKNIHSDPEMRYKTFQRTIEEFVSEEKKAKNLILYYNKNEELDQYDWVRECCYVVEHTISELLVLLVYYNPERLKNRPDFRKRILERIQYSPKREMVRQRLLNMDEEENPELERIKHQALPSQDLNETKATNESHVFNQELMRYSQLENQFNKGIPMQVVIDHFKVFTTTKNKRGEYYWTGDQLISFLKRCFLNEKNEPKQKFNFAKGEKGFVIKRFYEFYEIACSQYFVPNPKDPFIDRFTECIEFGKKSSFVSYFKNNKTKKQW